MHVFSFLLCNGELHAWGCTDISELSKLYITMDEILVYRAITVQQ